MLTRSLSWQLPMIEDEECNMQLQPWHPLDIRAIVRPHQRDWKNSSEGDSSIVLCYLLLYEWVIGWPLSSIFNCPLWLQSKLSRRAAVEPSPPRQDQARPHHTSPLYYTQPAGRSRPLYFSYSLLFETNVLIAWESKEHLHCKSSYLTIDDPSWCMRQRKNRGASTFTMKITSLVGLKKRLSDAVVDKRKLSFLIKVPMVAVAALMA